MYVIPRLFPLPPRTAALVSRLEAETTGRLSEVEWKGMWMTHSRGHLNHN
jgi:hypothetical protein